MSAKELKQMLKDARPKFGSTEEDLKKELEYHTTAKKALANKEKMAKVREARLERLSKVKGTEAEKTDPVKAPKAPVKAKPKAEKAPVLPSMPSESPYSRKAFLLAQLASLGSDLE